MKKTLILASNNKNKIAEIKKLLGDIYDIKSMGELGYTADIEENGETFLQNALIKAKTISEHFNADALADDSGLCVDFLNGAPGVYSARYSGIGATDEKNNSLLLKNLEDAENRRAEFVCVMVLYKPSGDYVFGKGRVSGEIIKSPNGNNGFGYDPIFYSAELKKTFAQATAAQKNKISHRYRAILDLKNKL